MVHSQAAEDDQDNPGKHQLAAAAAANSCKGCILLATVERQDTACCSEPLDMVLLALYFTHTHTDVHSHITGQSQEMCDIYIRMLDGDIMCCTLPAR